MRGDGFTTLTITVDPSRFERAMRDLAEASKRAASAFTRLSSAVTKTFRPLHGPHQFVADGRWQSTMCAAWVHDSCPLPAACDCTCHGRSLR